MPMHEYSYIARDMASAKVVSTAEGDALLVGGAVYHVSGPDGNAAESFAKAMRQAGSEDNPDVKRDCAAMQFEKANMARWAADLNGTTATLGGNEDAIGSDGWVKTAPLILDPVEPKAGTNLVEVTVGGDVYVFKGENLFVDRLTDGGIEVWEGAHGTPNARLWFACSAGKWDRYVLGE